MLGGIVSDLQDISQYLKDNNLIDGYIYKLFRWNDADLNNPTDKLMMLKQDGGGVVDRDVGRPFFNILIIGGKSEDPETGYSRAELIRDTMINDFTTGNVRLFSFINDIVGPLFIENDRPTYEVNFTALTSRG